MEHEIGLFFTILGFVVGALAIILTVAIYRKVNSIRSKQVENAQGPYKLNSSKNMNEIHRYFKEIIRITKNTDLDGDELDESINHSNVNAELNSYYQAEKKKMEVLLEKSTRELGAWTDLDQSVRLTFAEIIEDFCWLVNDFFEINRDEEMQIRIWIENHEKLITEKYTIEQILKANKEILS